MNTEKTKRITRIIYGLHNILGETMQEIPKLGNYNLLEKLDNALFYMEEAIDILEDNN